MSEFASNSNKSKQNNEPQQKLTPVVSSKASVKKTGIIMKALGLILPEDTTEAKRNVIERNVKPTLKKLIIDSLATYLNTSTNSSIGTAIGTTILKSGSVTNYNAASSQTTIKHSPGVYRFDPVDVATVEDADNIVKAMKQRLAECNYISIAQMYDLSGLGEIIKITDNNYGWTNLDSLTYRSYIATGGEYRYLIVCPPAVALPKRV